MDINKTINFMDYIVRELLIDEVLFEYKVQDHVNKKVDRVIEFIKQGDKYKQMWEELRKDTQSCGAWWQGELMGIEQKYFPEPTTKIPDTKLEELIKKVDDAVREILNS